MNLIQKLSRNAGLFLLASLLDKISAFILLPIIGRVLGVEQLGVYALAVAVVFMLGFFHNFGLAPVAVRELARDRQNAPELFSQILTLRLLLALAVYPLLCVVVLLGPYGAETRIVFCLMGLTIVCSAVSGACETENIAFERMQRVVIVRASASVLRNTFGILAMLLAPVHKLEFLVLAVVMVEASVALVWLYLVNRQMPIRLTFVPGRCKPLIMQALPFTGILFASQLNQNMSAFLLSTFRSPFPAKQAVGYFAPADSLTRFPIPLLQSLRMIIVPTVASGEHDPLTLAGVLEWSFKVVFWLVVVPMTIICFFFPGLILLTVFPAAKFAPSVPAFSVLGAAYSVEALTLVVTAYLAASREVHRFLPYVAISLLLNFCVGWMLISRFSFVGVAYGVLVAKLYALTMLIVLCRRIYGKAIFPFRRYTSLPVFLAGLYLASWLFRLAIPVPWAALAASSVLAAAVGTRHILHLRHLAGPGSRPAQAKDGGQTTGNA